MGCSPCSRLSRNRRKTRSRRGPRNLQSCRAYSLLGREILQQFLHGLVQVLLFLLLVGVGIESLGDAASPDKLLGRGIVHIKDQSAGANDGLGRRTHSAAPAKAACAVSVPLRLVIDRGLVTDKEIGLVAVRLGESFGGELRIDGLLDLRIHNLVGLGRTLNGDPLVGVIFGEIRSWHRVGADVLCACQRACHQRQNERHSESCYVGPYLPLHVYLLFELSTFAEPIPWCLG